MKQEVAYTNQKTTENAVNDIVRQLTKPASQYIVLLFFASSSYDIDDLGKKLKEKYPSSEVLGCSTAGELSKNGFSNNSLVVSALSCTKTRVSGVLVHDMDKFPIKEERNIEDAAIKCGIQPGSLSAHNDAFAFCLVNGVRYIEESFLALFHHVIKDPDFIIAGGSAGDDMKIKDTYIFYNGETVTNGVAILFFKTSCAFDIRKENIFEPMGAQVKVTASDIYARKILSLDGISASKKYAEILGVSEATVDNMKVEYPLGRILSGSLFIFSPSSINRDGSISMFGMVMPNSVLEVLKPINAVETAEKTCASISEKIPNPGAVIIVNCVYRSIYFSQHNMCSDINSVYRKYFPVYCGFSSYGEQFGCVNTNATQVSIVISE